MHGKLFLLDSIYAGIDENDLYGRIDFADQLPECDFEIAINAESWAENSTRPRRAVRLEAEIKEGKLSRYSASENSETLPNDGISVVLDKTFEFKLPLDLLYALPPQSSSGPDPAANRIRLRFSVWQNKLPVDALPVEGWMELQLLPEADLKAMAQ
jgi:hypothetical protein